MLEELKSAARRVGGDRHLRGLMIDCKRLLSERGEANGGAIARDLVARFGSLPDEQRASSFERLSRDFSPDPRAVLHSAQAYAAEPSARNLAALTHVTERRGRSCSGASTARRAAPRRSSRCAARCWRA